MDLRIHLVGHDTLIRTVKSPILSLNCVFKCCTLQIEQLAALASKLDNEALGSLLDAGDDARGMMVSAHGIAHVPIDTVPPDGS